MPKISSILVTLCLALPCAAHADLKGVVIGVPDGDTLTVLVQRQVLQVRLTNIEAPEEGQPFRAHATRSLVHLCQLRHATVEDVGIGAERQVFGRVECDGVDASAEQVRRGMAWVTDEYQPAEPVLHAFQNEARAAQRGLWSDAQPIPPWQWGKQQR